jgi:hypothetical protein
MIVVVVVDDDNDSNDDGIDASILFHYRLSFKNKRDAIGYTTVD